MLARYNVAGGERDIICSWTVEHRDQSELYFIEKYTVTAGKDEQLSFTLCAQLYIYVSVYA